MILLFIGPSGSGKDTQAELLVKDYDYTRVSSGDLMRAISDGEHPIQGIIKQAMNEGFLADNFVFGLLQIYLSSLKKDDLILSGVVRRESQIELLDFTLFKLNKKLDYVVSFELNDEEAIKRMSGRSKCKVCSMNYHEIYNPSKVAGKCDNCGGDLVKREDDNPESIKKRLEDFYKDNKEILDMYERRGILIKIDASNGIEEIYKEVVEKLKIKN